MTVNLLPAVEAFITQRISDLAKFNPHPADRIEELEMVRTLCRGLQTQEELLNAALLPKNHE